MIAMAERAVRPSVWWPVDVDPEQVAAEIERWFPGVSAWFGDYTGKWWAVVGYRMVEADTPDGLREEILRAAPSSWRAARGRGSVAREVVSHRSMTARPLSSIPAYYGEPFRPTPSRFRRFLNGVRRFFLGQD